MENITRDIRSRMEVVDVKYDVEFILNMDGRVVLLPSTLSKDIIGNATLIESGRTEANIPSSLKVVERLYGNDLLDGEVELSPSLYNNTILMGEATIENSEEVSSGILYGTCEFVNDEASHEINGSAIIPIVGYKNDFLLGRAQINEVNLSRYITGSAIYMSGDFVAILNGTAYLPQEKVSNDLLTGELEYLGGELETGISGELEYVEGKTDKILMGTAEILAEDGSKDLLTGILEYQGGEISKDLIVGKGHVDNHLHSSYLMGWGEIKPTDLKYSIFSSIQVPHSVMREFMSRIEVDDSNYHKQNILAGQAEIKQENSGVDLLVGRVELLPTIYEDIVGEAEIEPIHTRREFSASMSVVSDFQRDLPSSIEVIDPIRRIAETDLPSRIIVGRRGYAHIPSSIVVDRSNDNSGLHPKHVGARIAIVVSPTWRYEPFVFKSCLVTLFDRYYRKLDIDLVFGGSKRSDFDIINLANNYRIRGDHLLQVPIHYDFNNHARTMASIDHFIHHMSEPKEGYPLSRVFLFLDKPSWYYNDPIGKIAEWCKINNVSCVGIDSGGDFQEILDINKVMDAINMSVEFKRHERRHPRYAIENRRLPDVDPNEIVF